MPSWKPKCQTVWHACVQGPINCPVHCFHPNSSRVKRLWVTVTIYMEISNTTAGLPKLPKCSLFIWKAIIMFTGGVKAGRCLNTAVTLCAWVCLESFISISIDAQFGLGAWQKSLMANTRCVIYILLLQSDVLTSLICTKQIQLDRLCQFKVV